jgi:hypothetical protein
MAELCQCSDRIQSLLANAVKQICQSEVNCENKLRLQGLLGITIDDQAVFLVQINEQILLDVQSDLIDGCNVSSNASQLCLISDGTPDILRSRIKMPSHSPGKKSSALDAQDRHEKTLSSTAEASNHTQVLNGDILSEITSRGDISNVLLSCANSETLDTKSEINAVPPDDSSQLHQSIPSDDCEQHSSDNESHSHRIAMVSVDSSSTFCVSPDRPFANQRDEKFPNQSSRLSFPHTEGEKASAAHLINLGADMSSDSSVICCVY